MASTYVNDLRLEEIASGEQPTTWGTTTNKNLELIGEAFSYGTRAIANAGTDNITIANGTSDADRSIYLKCTGGGQACTITLLPVTSSKIWIMENATSYTLTFTQGSGANVVVLAGQVKIIATSSESSDGAGDGIVYDLTQDLAVPDLFVDDDVTLQSDGAVINFGENSDVTLTHVHDTGLLLNSTMQLQFNDASQFINAPSNVILDITATDEVEINATELEFNGTTADINANLDVSGTYTGGGLMTTGGNIVISNAGNIGSASDTDAIAISSGGDVTVSQDLTVTGAASFGSVSSLGTLPSLTVSGTTTLNGNIALGSDASDGITFYGDVLGNVTPNGDSLYNLGGTTLYWANLYVDSVFTTGDVYFGTASSLGISVGASLLFTGGGDQYGYGAKAGSTAATYFYSIVNTSGGHEGGLYMTSGTISLQNLSDYRLKENISTLTGAVDKVKALNPVRFKRNDYEDAVMQNGFLAHEVQAVVPEAVVGEKDAVKEDGSIDPQSMDVALLIPVLTSALKEALAKIEVLESKVAALEAS